jgi:hypothetical protein
MTITHITPREQELMATVAELEKENNFLRASTANNGGPCLYCALPKEKWGECAAGFPGCSRGDDAMLCPNVGAELESMEKIAELEKDAARYRFLSTWKFEDMKPENKAMYGALPADKDVMDAAIDDAMQLK